MCFVPIFLNDVSVGNDTGTGMNVKMYSNLKRFSKNLYIFMFKDAMPLRLKAFHYINTGPYMDRIMSLMRPFMRPELYLLVNIHSQGMDSFYQHVEQRILPKDMGGDAPDLEELRSM